MAAMVSGAVANSQTATGAFLLPPVAPASTVGNKRNVGTGLRGAVQDSELVDATIGRNYSAEVGFVACVCGFVASLAVGHRTARRRSSTSRVFTRLRATAVQEREDAPMTASRETTAAQLDSSVDDVEATVAKFVPKIHALQSQAEMLRTGELRQVLDTMKDLRKTELRGVFGEVDQLLCALVDAIHGMRESAVTIRKSELRQQFEQLDHDAKAWVSDIEQATVKTVTGYSKREAVDTMMEVHVIGLSHHSAPVDVREKLAVAQDRWNQYAQDLVEFSKTPNGCMVPEVAVLSTCNRFELYFATPELMKMPAVEMVHDFLRHKSGLSRQELDPFLFQHSGEAAINHLFEVSSGLDSLVLGEAQILAQVKACHERCTEKDDPTRQTQRAGSGGKILAKMLNAGIRIGKLVRSRTKIGKGSVSVSSAAVELMISRALADCKKRSGDLNVCILGAGKMGRLLMIALFTKHPDIRVTMVNRSVDKAEALLEELANRGGVRAKVAPLDQMWEVIKASDVVFAATSSEEPIMTAADLTGIHKPLMLVDISVPRNIGADCGTVDSVVSYSVDDLKKVVQANAEKRQAEVLKAKVFIKDDTTKFKLWQASQGAVPYLAALQARGELIRKTETDKMARRLKGLHTKEREAVDKLTRHIVDSLFEPIYYSMKDAEDIDQKKNKIWALRNMFRLEPVYKRGNMLAAGEEATLSQLDQGSTPRQLTG